MKKIILILLALAMCAALFACGEKEAMVSFEGPAIELFENYNIPKPVGLEPDGASTENGINYEFFIIPPVMASAAQQVFEEYIALLGEHGVDLEYVEEIDSFKMYLDGKEVGFVALIVGEDPMIATALYANAAASDIPAAPAVPEEPDEVPTMPEPEIPAVPEPVEITMDNWAEYFEFTYEYDYDYNGFDELEDVTMWFYFSLKPEYAAMLDGDKSDVTVEIFFITGTQFGTFSEDFLEFTPDGYFDEWFDYESAREQDVHELSYNSSKGIFRTSYQTAHADFEESSMGPWYPTSQEVIRIAGTLVFK